MSQPFPAPASPAPGLIRLKPPISGLGQGYEEYRVAAGYTVKPGMMLEITGVDANGAQTVKPDGSANSYAGPLIISMEGAFTADVPGAASVATGGIDDTFAAGDLVRAYWPQKGEVAYMRLAASQTVTLPPDSNILTSNGDGTLKKLAGGVSGTGQRAFVPEEAVTTSGSAGWIRARVI
jgi:hypothetical protein